ncbi:DUF1385 domain-containing protein [Christensenellaceae bacterium OttesenSCG-928-K19]|nr:DUF1385 domain-containing protein [Christensenellaceae bacterium OttesenSCG-928-K19]
MKKTNIGGQGVLEGVMMRSPKVMAIAVRQEPGNIVTQKQDTQQLSQKYKILGVPIIRGVVNFVEMLIMGVKTITDAAKLYDPELDEEEEVSKAEKFIAEKTGKQPMDVAIFFAVIIAIVLAVGMFFILPNLVTGWITPYINTPILKNLVDGLIRVIIFIVYMFAISSMKDIKRLFGYHGAEHKVINCYEHGKPLDVENAMACSRFHPRCGTSFMLIVMVISILLFSVLGWSEEWYLRILLRLAMLPIVAGVSYEVLKLLGNADNKFVDVLRAPGMALQRLSTREPDEGMVEVALVSFQIALNEKTEEEIDTLIQDYSRETPEEEQHEDNLAEETAKEV